MKISLKIFIFTYCIIVLVTVLGGFWLIDYEYRKGLSQAKVQAVEQNETLYTYVATIEELLDKERAMYSLDRLIERMSGETGRDVLVGSYESLKEQLKIGKAEELKNNQYVYNIYEEQGSKILQVTSRYEEQYIINYYDSMEIIRYRDVNYELYRKIIMLVSSVIAIALYLFSEWHIRKIEEEARRKEEFMGNFAHEMKTPMTAIIGYADMLRSFDLPPDKRRAYSNFIYKEGKRVEQLSLHLLQMIVLNKNEFELQQVQTGELFAHLKEEAVFLEKKYGVQVRFKYDKTNIPIEKALMLTAILNLIDNACKASRKGEQVYVLGKLIKDNYAIAIVDCGEGIPETELEKITEPFYMVDKSRARKQGGAGLGLSLTQRIIKLHGGKLRIESKIGEGTSVTIWLKKH